MIKWKHMKIVWGVKLDFHIKSRLDVLNYITVIRPSEKELKEYLKELEENE